MDVHQHEVPFLVADLLKGDAAVFGLADGEVLEFTPQGVLGDDDVEGIVLRNEDAHGAEVLLCQVRTVFLDFHLGDLSGKGKGKRGPFIFDTFHPDYAPLQLDDLLGDAQAEPGATELPGLQGVPLVEAFEYLLQLVLGDADAGVLDPHHEVLGMGLGGRDTPGRELREGLHRSLHGDAAFQREFDRVADEVDQDLVQAAGIAIQVGGESLMGLDGEGEVLLLGGNAHDILRDLHGVLHGEGLAGDFQLAGLELGEVEDVVDDVNEVAGCRDDVAQVLPRHFRHVLLVGEVGHAHDGIERGPDFVGHVGQEDGLVVQGDLQFGIGPDELALSVLQLLSLGGDESALALGKPVAVGDEHRKGDEQGHDGVEVRLALLLQPVLVGLHLLLAPRLPFEHLEADGGLVVFRDALIRGPGAVPNVKRADGGLVVVHGCLGLSDAVPTVCQARGPAISAQAGVGHHLLDHAVAQGEAEVRSALGRVHFSEFGVEVNGAAAAIFLVHAQSGLQALGGIVVAALAVGDVAQVFVALDLVGQVDHLVEGLRVGFPRLVEFARFPVKASDVEGHDAHLAAAVVDLEDFAGFLEVVQGCVVLRTAVGIQQEGDVDPGLGQFQFRGAVEQDEPVVLDGGLVVLEEAAVRVTQLVVHLEAQGKVLQRLGDVQRRIQVVEDAIHLPAERAHLGGG